MKKTLLVALLMALGFFETMHAQTVNLGAKAGMNVSSFYGNRSDNQIERNSLIGFHAGFIAEVKFSDAFALQPELLYSRAGAEEENVVAFQLDYISVPVMAKFYIADRFSLDVGPQFSFLVNDTAKFRFEEIPDYDTDANTFDLALNAGLGIDFAQHWFSQLRYSYGITKVGENPDINNGIFQLSVGYRF
ncbi:porin family protein [Tamlana crocina]|uniref:PorT family protein n=1 Tax=Tamlana crocina TaxID=393006 RepID=A0ABX1DBA9_9FLAO|nr:porin family protein [Tamlana crocina]NJX15357.1 PorT family protein [Tamlana crocina]